MVHTPREDQDKNIYPAEIKESSILVNRARNLVLAVLSAAGISGCTVYIHPVSGTYSQSYYDPQPKVVETVYVSSPVIIERRHTIVIWGWRSHRKKHHH